MQIRIRMYEPKEIYNTIIDMKLQLIKMPSVEDSPTVGIRAGAGIKVGQSQGKLTLILTQ